LFYYLHSKVMNKPIIVWIVDDDPAFQLITKTNISRTGIPVNYHIFSNGKDALDAMTSVVNEGHLTELPSFILLDINMPIYDGWYFVNGYSGFSDNVKNKTELFVCSSSIDPADISRSESNDDVTGFIEKPIPTSILTTILSSKL
jgi:CheY-like chemotaxis protein